ncbi:MAG TPA: RluA family pseudouridine synthase [Pyrinomonadaceae bacterium]|nr:RluA family pseudouridine synthase [Pyrinomonadaceae bacterium]
MRDDKIMDGPVTNLTFEIDAGSRKQKLGDYLTDNLRGLSKMYLRELIKTGRCEVNGRIENSGYRLRQNDFIELGADLSRGRSMRPEDLSLEIVFEDEELLVVNKPAGMLMHPSHRENSGTLLNAVVHYLNFREGGSERAFIRPGLPHRLDKQTSGLVLVAKTLRSHRALSRHFMHRRVEKRYLALVEGLVRPDHGSIVAPIGRDADLKSWGVRADGKHSESRFVVRQRRPDGTTLVELEPVTGRTNQLRIHCESVGHPIVGDAKRGGREFARLCLHAHKLGFPHPVGSAWQEFETPAFF